MNMGYSILRALPLAALSFAIAGCPDENSNRPTGNTLGETDSATASVGDTENDTFDSESDSDADSDTSSDICLAHNCESDLECGGCSNGENTCYLPDKRCVACNPDTGDGCEAGEECTEFGQCVPEGLTCDTDDEGVPTIECNDDPDCAACDPDHQVCSAGRCVQCRGDATDACQSTEICVANECVAKCPTECSSNDECGECTTTDEDQSPLNACHNHQCAECSNTSSTPISCPNGEVCTDQGVCVPQCGIPGQSPGVCESDADCQGCEGDNTNCIIPINDDRGTCGPVASGCSDLGEGVVVLPEPFSQVTNACSDDPDCEGVGVQYNVGELLRELTGFNEIDDAIVEYPMSRCAELTVGSGGSSISCGICVPCEEDNDCQDLDIDEVAGDAFGPLGAVATALLLDQLFGPTEHVIHMFCQPVAAGYGACVPCPNLLSDCSVGGGGGGSGMCEHGVDEVGSPLDPMCGACAEAVCAVDDFCCNTEWDEVCVNAVDIYCTTGACHDQCDTGEALNPSCNECVETICDDDPYCCETEWDEVCVNAVDDFCGGECVGDGCSHDECSAGGALDSTCSDCATAVCDADPFCCETEWDTLCVEEAEGQAACSC